MNESRRAEWKRPLLRAALASILLITPLLVWADTAALLRLIHDSQGQWLILGLFAAIGILLARAERFRVLLTQGPDSDGRSRFLVVVAWHQLVFTLLPSGLGDLLFPPIARRHLATPVSEATAVLVLTRVQDLCALIVMAGIGLSLARARTDGAALQTSPFVWAAIPASLALLYHADRAVALAIRITGKILDKIGLAGSDRLAPLLASLEGSPSRGESSVARRQRGLTSLWTVVSWLGAVTLFWCVFQAFGVKLDPAESLVVVSGVNFAGALAFFTLAGVGVSEAGLAAVLVLLGTPAAEATVQALAIRPTALGLAVCAPLLLLGTLRAFGSADPATKARPRR